MMKITSVCNGCGYTSCECVGLPGRNETFISGKQLMEELVKVKDNKRSIEDLIREVDELNEKNNKRYDTYTGKWVKYSS